MELNKMTNQQVSKRMYDYLISIENLMKQISEVIHNRKNEVDLAFIKTEYKRLKLAIKEDAHYVSLSRNDSDKNSVLQTQFKWVIDEAAAFGFSSSTNSKVDIEMWRSLEEANYKLKKHTSLDEWKKLSESV